MNVRARFFGSFLDGLVGTTPATKDGLLYRWFTGTTRTCASVSRVLNLIFDDLTQV